MPIASPLKPLSNPLFRRLWLGNMSANLGTMFQSVGAAWLMMTMTGSPQMVALVQTSVTLPMLLLSLFAGVLADTFDRRRILMFAQFYMFSVAVILTILSITGQLTPTLLLVATLLIGCGSALLIPSWQASLRELVDRSDLAAAVAIHSMGFNLMRSAGPALGGAILALSGASILFALGGLCYLVFAFVLAFWRNAVPQGTTRESLPSALLSGLRYSAMSPSLVFVFARGIVFCAFGVVLIALLPVVAGQMLGGGAVLFGVLLGSFGLGAVMAAILSTTLRARFSTEQIVRLTFVVMGVCLLAIALVANVLVVTIATFIAGCCWVLTNSTLNVTVQLSVPTWVAGRSLSILHTSLFGGMTIGSIGWGIFAENAGVQAALIAAAVVLLLTSFMGYFMPLPEISDDRFEPANRFKEPEVQVDLSKHDGPITIVIHYSIKSADMPAFLATMKLQRRIRRRDGALRWTLRRDVEHPDHWSETYTVRTWADYVRHNLRRTESDVKILDKLWSLHQGPRSPVILRMVEWDAAHGEPEDDQN